MHEIKLSFIGSPEKLIRFVSLSIVLSISFISSVRSQGERDHLVTAWPEKIYLQLDGKVYTTDQTIWFKAIVTNTDHNPTMLSGVLAVELIGPDELIVDRKLLKLENGVGQGEFELFANYKPGHYLIRAYTRWNKNFANDFIFEQYVDVFLSLAVDQKRPIEDFALVEKDPEVRP